MKTITEYIKESYIKESNQSIFDNIDPKDFKWQTAYSDDSYQEKCKEEVKKFADKIYKDLKSNERLEKLYRDSYKMYISSGINKSQEKIDAQYDDQIKLIDKYGWSQFEWSSLEQGWWVFMYWVKNKIK